MNLSCIASRSVASLEGSLNTVCSLAPVPTARLAEVVAPLYHSRVLAFVVQTIVAATHRR